MIAMALGLPVTAVHLYPNPAPVPAAEEDMQHLGQVESGRSAGVPWHHLADALCVTSKPAAYQKARRLKADQVREPGERRTPEVAREHEERAAAEVRAERAHVLVQERRFPLAQRIGRLFLEHRDGFVMDSWSEYWLGEVAETIDNRRDTTTKRARFTGWVESFVRAVHGHARERSQPSTTTEEARRALALATEFTYQQRPEIPWQVQRSQTGNRSQRERRCDLSQRRLSVLTEG